MINIYWKFCQTPLCKGQCVHKNTGNPQVGLFPLLLKQPRLEPNLRFISTPKRATSPLDFSSQLPSCSSLSSPLQKIQRSHPAPIKSPVPSPLQSHRRRRLLGRAPSPVELDNPLSDSRQHRSRVYVSTRSQREDSLQR